MSKNVAVLGCGPTGLLVAWAVEQAGHQPTIYSRKEKSIIPGSQHLHGPIPGLTSPYPEGTIQFVRIGTARNYALKVYGEESRETGWDNYLQVFPSWNVLRAYDKLWVHFADRIVDAEISGYVPKHGDPRPDLKEILTEHDMVISTVPAQALCWQPSEHHFSGVPYFIQKLPTPPADEHHEIVVYNGRLEDPWYRWSILGGLCSVEFMRRPADVGLEIIAGTKAVSNTCTCWPTIHRCGRWAEWTHGVTMYRAYKKAEQLLQEGA